MFASPGAQLLRRQSFTVVTVFIIGMVLTVLTIVFAPRKYQSQAKLLLKLGRENVALDPTVTTTGDLVSLHRTYEGEINTALQTMASREILEMVVEEVGQAAILRGSLDDAKKSGGLLSRITSIPKGVIASLDPIDDQERAILALQEDLAIDAAKESSVVDITYRANSPELAQRVTQAWVDLYRRHHADINSTEGSLEFFVELESELADSLEQARSALEKSKSKFGIVTVSGEQQTLESQVRWARSSLIETTTSLKAAEAKLRSLEGQLNSTKPTVVIGKDKADTNEARDRMRDRLYQLEIEHQRISTMYADTHPKYIVAKQQLQEARELFNEQTSNSERVTEGVNSTYESIEQQIALEKANIDFMQAKMDATNSELKRLLEQSTSLNQHENEVARLQRSVDILESQYRLHVQNREQARLASELESRDISNVNVFQTASLEHRPVTPNKKLCAVLGTIASLMIAMGLATWREAKRAASLAPQVDQPLVGQPIGDHNESQRSNEQLTGQTPPAQILETSFDPTRDSIGSTVPSVPR